MYDAWKNWLSATAVLWATLGLSGLTCTTVTGCNDPQTGDTHEQRSASADQRLKASAYVMEEFGIEGTAFVEVGPGWAGLFNGAMWNSGVKVNAVLKADPMKAKAWAKAMDYIDRGMSPPEAVAKTRAELNIPKTPASQPADDPPAEDEDD